MVQRQVGQFGAATLAGAFIGDNFIHSGPGAGPFVWNANQTVTFNLHIDGTQARLPTTPGIDRSQLVLMIYRPGTLDSDVPYCTPNVLNRYVWSIGANALPTDDCGSPTQGTINAGGNGNVNQNMQVTFAPGGDFAWALGIKLYTAAVGVLLTGPAYWNNDFSNTLTYSYAAPDGATVQSSSGYSIPRYTPPTSVPEPGTLALLGLGLAGLGIARRRRLADC